MCFKLTRRNNSPSPRTRCRPPLAEALEQRQLLSATLHPNYTGTLTLSKALPVVVATDATATTATSRRLAFDLTISSQSDDGEFSGDLSTASLGTFAFEGSSHGSAMELIFEGNSGGAGVLIATLSRNGAALNGRWTSTMGSQRITGGVRATAGGATVSSADAPPAIGQSATDTTASGPFAQMFNGTAQIAGAASSSSTSGSSSNTTSNSGTTTSSGTTAVSSHAVTGSTGGTVGAVTGNAGAIPIADSTGAIAGSTGAIAGATGAITGSMGAITGAAGAITGSPTGAINGGAGAVTGSTGAITGSTGAITGSIGAGAIAGSTGAITGGAGAIPIAGSTGAITGATGAITGTGISAMGFGSGLGTSTPPASTSTTPSQTNPVGTSAGPTVSTQTQAIVLTVNSETSDGLITGSVAIGGTVFSFDGFISRNQFSMVLLGGGTGHAQGTLGKNRSVFQGTFAIQSGTAPMSGSFSASSKLRSA